MKSLVKLSLITSLLLASHQVSAEPLVMTSPADYQAYQSSHGKQVSVSVTDTMGANWKKYSSFLGKEKQWLWVSNNGEELYWYNSSNKRELLLDANDAVGTEYKVTIDGCTDRAVIADKEQAISTQASDFSQAIQLNFSGYCFDAGLKSAWFVPGTGLVKWREDSLLGPVDFELQHAKVNGMTLPNYQGLELAAQFPSDTVLLNEQDSVEAYITLVNHSDKTIKLDFRSGQTFDIYLYDANEQLVSQWSADRMFTQALHSIEIKPGAAERFGDELQLLDLSGEPLDIGTYRLKVEITGSFAPLSTQRSDAYGGQRLSAESPLHLDSMMTHY